MSESGAEDRVLQIKVTLQHIRPPIWRRLLVPARVTLGELHHIIQAAFGWWDYHLHQFIVGETYYGVPNPDYDGYMDMRDEDDVTLAQVARAEGTKFRYEYDFGDSWIHQVLVEKIVPAEPDQVYPVCIKGRRARPPEDVGGFPGYEYFLEAIQDSDHDEHERYLEWVGGEFDPEAFDLEAVNTALAALAQGTRRAGLQAAPAAVEGPGLALTDRAVAIIRPKQPFVDWVNRILGGAEAVTLDELVEDRVAVLVPDLETMDAVRDLLDPIKPVLFEIELEEWTGDPGDWPTPRTAALFDDWFDVEVYSMVLYLAVE